MNPHDRDLLYKSINTVSPMLITLKYFDTQFSVELIDKASYRTGR
jgi:hypothetical protein